MFVIKNDFKNVSENSHFAFEISFKAVEERKEKKRKDDK